MLESPTQREMSALRPFGIALRRHIKRRAKVKRPLTTETQDAQPASAPFSENWTSEHSYKYFKDDGSQDIWSKCEDLVQDHDEQVYTDLKEEITFLLVVAGLFLSIVTAFTIESYKLLQEDKQDTISDLLVEVVRLLNDTSAQGHAQLPKRFTPDHRNVVVNQLWFLSIILSLIAVLIGTFCLQWVSTLHDRKIKRKDKSVSLVYTLAVRDSYHRGVAAWGVDYAPDALLLTVQLSIAFFISGLLYFIWDINRAAAIPALVVAGIASIPLCIVNMMPFFQSLLAVVYPRIVDTQCPYQSPTSWLVRLACQLLLSPLRRSLKSWMAVEHVREGVLQRFHTWLVYCSSGGHHTWRSRSGTFLKIQRTLNSTSIERLVAMGISSALDVLILEPNAADIIRHSIRSLRATSNLAYDFGQRLSSVVESILNNDIRGRRLINPNLTLSREDQHLHYHDFLDDFTNALILQNIADRSAKLDHLFLRHRVELYIRLKNSMLFLFQASALYTEFDSCVDLPIRRVSDVNQLDLELKFQFLKYLNRIRGTGNPIHPDDYLLCAQIIRMEGVECPVSAQCTICLRNQQMGLSGANGSVNGSRVDDHQLRAAFRDLCRSSKEWLFALPDPFEEVQVGLVRELLETRHP